MNLKKLLLTITVLITLIAFSGFKNLHAQIEGGAKPITNIGFTSQQVYFNMSYLVVLQDTTSYQNGIKERKWIVDGDTSSYSGGYMVPKIHLDSFPAAGSYNITLIVQDSSLNSDTVTKAVVISDFLFTGFHFYQVGGPYSKNFHFIDTSLMSMPVARRTWEFHDDTVSYNKDTLKHIYKLYQAPGLFPVRLITEDTAGNVDSSFHHVQVDHPINAGFVYSQSNYPVYNQITFVDTTQPPTPFQSRMWIIGNDTTQTGQYDDTVHTQAIPQAGTHMVKMVLSSAFGTVDTATQFITVNEPASAGFTMNQLSSPPYFSVQFKDTTRIPQGFYKRTWYFPNDTVHVTQLNKDSITHTFSLPGKYWMKFEVEDSSGSKNVFTDSIKVEDNPLAHMSGSVTAGSQTVDSGYAVLFEIKLSGKLKSRDTTQIISGPGYSYFYFNQVGLMRDYIVRVSLYPSDSLYDYYLPTYYGNLSDWKTATHLFADSLYIPAPIKLVSIFDEFGNGQASVSGHVTYQISNTPVQELTMILKDNNGTPVRVTQTNASGYYEFTNLPLSTVMVEPEYAGFHASGATLFLTPSTMNVTNVDFQMKDTSIVPDNVSIVEQYPKGNEYISVYPNPATDKLFVDLSALKKPELLRVYTSSGQLLFHKKLVKNEPQFKINSSTLHSGLFILEVTSAQGVFTKKILIQ